MYVNVWADHGKQLSFPFNHARVSKFSTSAITSIITENTRKGERTIDETRASV